MKNSESVCAVRIDRGIGKTRRGKEGMIQEHTSLAGLAMSEKAGIDMMAKKDEGLLCDIKN
jgi:hypothetical protein